MNIIMWTVADIAGKAADVFDPTGDTRPRFGILFLHDAAGETLKSSPVVSQWLMKLHLACVCPQGGRCWWADRVCAEFDPNVTVERHLLDRVLPYFRERWGLEPCSVALLGIGMGGQGALRLAFKHAELFPVVAGLGSALDHHELHGQGTPLDEMYDSKEQCRQDTALLHVPPHHPPPHIFFGIDPDDRAWYRGNDRLHEKLNALGVAHETDFTTHGGGHSWAYFERMAERVMRFLHAGLELESRRLL